MTAPNFFIVGAAKAGTTSVYNYLAAHPEAYLSPVKEPHHFATDINSEHLRAQERERMAAQDIDAFINGGMEGTLHRAFITDRSQYLRLFEKAGTAKVIGEASVSYLYSSTAASAIHAFNPQARIIIVLRNPADRAWSHYLMDLRLGNTQLSFADALKADAAIPHKTWGAASLYFELGLYYDQVKRYLDLFPREQVLILLQEDLHKDPAAVVKQVYQFLGIDDSVQPDISQRHNSAMVPKNVLAEKLVSMGSLKVRIRRLIKGSALHRSLKRWLFAKPEKSAADVHVISGLRERYREDIRKLAVLIGRDLSGWE